jgi:hypothetical protein
LVARVGFTTGSMSAKSIRSTADCLPTTLTNNSSINNQSVCYDRIARTCAGHED